MDKTRDSTNSKIWPDSTCAISVWRKGQILLVVESLVLSTTITVGRLHPSSGYRTREGNAICSNLSIECKCKILGFLSTLEKESKSH